MDYGDGYWGFFRDYVANRSLRSLNGSAFVGSCSHRRSVWEPGIDAIALTATGLIVSGFGRFENALLSFRRFRRVTKGVTES